MADNQTLEQKIKVTSQDATSDLQRLTSTLGIVKNQITSIKTSVDSVRNSTKQVVTYTTNSGAKVKATLNETGNVIKKITTASNQASKSTNSMFNLNKLYLVWNLTKRLRDGIKGWVKSAIDYNETVNKFNVSMGTSINRATQFQNKLSEAFGTSRTEMMNYQSNFKNVMSGLGSMSTDMAEQVSESLVKMGLDYSSLFNVDQASAMSKFQSALVGSIRPIRADSGYDVSESTIGAKAKTLGLDRTVGQLNETEKRLLRIIVLMEQMKNTGAFNDLSRTIESPANQIKVLKNQIQELGVWIGNVFMGTIGKVLPYINGFVMALKEMAKTIAYLRGFVSGSAGINDAFEVAEDSSYGISNNLGNSVKKAKELKKTLMGFDVLNVISTPKEDKSDIGEGYIDPKILGALSSYESKLDSVKMKATDIRDTIMEWLGFTKQVDDATGEVTWVLQDGYTNLEKIKDIAILIGEILLGWKIASGVANFLTDLGIGRKSSNLKKALGITLAIPSITFYTQGVKGITDGELTSESFMKAFGGAVGLGVSAGMLTGSWRLGLIIALGSIGFSGGLSIGQWLNEHYGDSYTWYLKKFKVDLSDGVDFSDVMGIIGTMLGTIGDAILDGFKNLWNILPDSVKNSFRIILAALTGGISEIVIFIVKHWDDLKKFFTETIPNFFTKTIPEWGRKIGQKISEIWNNNISPWFTKEKWSDLAKKATDAVKEKFNELKEKFNPIKDWWNENVKPWFTWEKWRSLGQDAVDGIKSAFNNLSIRIKMPHFTWTTEPAKGWISNILSTLNLPTSLPKLNVDWYAGGGFPGVGQMFVAREAGPELVGNIGNRTAVVNNDQIVESVSRGVAQAVSQVLGSQSGGYNLYIDGKQITDVVQKRIARNNNIYGMA